jgi:NADH-quinone oxidoreductase subunit J
MDAAFYLAGAVAILSTAMVITRLNAVHALLYLIVSLLAVGVTFFLLGAPFIAMLEVIIYAGAIMMLFIFAVMMLNLGPLAVSRERQWLPRRAWVGPGLLAGVLLAELAAVLAARRGATVGTAVVPPEAVGAQLFGPYLLAVELAALLLFAGLIGAYYIGQRFERGGRP